jgi:hypothetical protein
MARSDWIVLVTEPAAEYRIRTALERLGLRPYLPQARRQWSLPHGAQLRKLYPQFACCLLLPITEVDLPVLRVVAHLRQPPILTDAHGRWWLIPGGVVTRLLELELTGTFDDARPTQQHRQADADLEIAHWTPREFTSTVPCDPDAAIRRLVGQLAHAARPAGFHAGA